MLVEVKFFSIPSIKIGVNVPYICSVKSANENVRVKKRLHDALLLMRTSGSERIMFCATRKKQVISMYTTTSCGMLFAASSRCYFEATFNLHKSTLLSSAMLVPALL